MGEALAVGLLDGGWEPETLAVAEIDAERRHVLEERLPGVRVVPSPAWAAADADVARGRGEAGRRRRRRSRAAPTVAARGRARPLDRGRGHPRRRSRPPRPGRPVVRAMPNTGALVGRARPRSPPARTPPSSTSSSRERVLGAVGIVVRVPEAQLDAVTGLSGSGPAYVFLRRRGDDRSRRARRPAARHAASSSCARRCSARRRCSADGDATPESLRAAVTSPGGTTAAGLAVLEAHGVRAAFLDAVDAATDALATSSGQRVSRKPRSSRLPPKLPDPATRAARRAEHRARACASGSSDAHVAGRSARFGRDEVVGVDAARRRTATPTRALRAPAVRRAHARRRSRRRSTLDLRMGRRRTARAHRADAHDRRLRRRVRAGARGRARRRAARVRDRASGVAAAALPRARGARRPPRAATCSWRDGDRARSGPAGRRVRWVDGVAVLTDGARLLADDSVDAAEEWLFTLARPDLVVADRTLRRASRVGERARGGRVRRPRRGRRWRSPPGAGRAVRVVPARRAPTAPAPTPRCSICSRIARPPPRSTRFGRAPELPRRHAARSCSFATRAAGAYAHPAEKRGKRKG